MNENDDGVTMKNPCVIGPTEKGLGFFPWMPFADLENFVFPRSEIRYMVEVKKELKNEYATLFSKLVVPNSGLKLVQ